MDSLDKKEGNVSGDSDNDVPQVKVVVCKQSREGGTVTVKNICLTLGFHNGMLQVLPPLWAFSKMTVASDHKLVFWESEGKGTSFSIVGSKICESYCSR